MNTPSFFIPVVESVRELSGQCDRVMRPIATDLYTRMTSETAIQRYQIAVKATLQVIRIICLALMVLLNLTIQRIDAFVEPQVANTVQEEPEVAAQSEPEVQSQTIGDCEAPSTAHNEAKPLTPTTSTPAIQPRATKSARKLKSVGASAGVATSDGDSQQETLRERAT